MRDTEDRSGHFLHRKEGVTQGGVLAMIAYGIGFLPLIKELRDVHPCVTHTWYADDAGTGGGFGRIIAHSQDLQARGTPQGYFLEPTNIILVVVSQNVARAEDFFCGVGIKVVTDSCYLEV